jgi:hypothetical protein
MEQNTATPEPDWAALGWITHRQPGLMDADAAGHVWLPREITSTPTGNTTFVNYRLIAPGQPWWSRHVPEMQDNEPAPTEPDRIAALEQRLAELEAFKDAVMQPSPIRYSLRD